MNYSNLDQQLDLSHPDELKEEDAEKLKNAPNLSDFQRDKLNKDAKKNWDLFYKRNGDRFFKNRHWTRHEFKELFEDTLERYDGKPDNKRFLLEVGCGCGDFVLPLLTTDGQSSSSCDGFKRPKDLFIYCCDISNKAIEILKSKSLYKQHSPEQVKAFTADITLDRETLISETEGTLMDIVSLIFVLSALDPSYMKQALENLNSLLKPGGLILFRDYAIYDKAMLRFGQNSKICDQFYVRQDGTRAYFFSKEQLCNLFLSCNFQCQSIDYVRRETINNATKERFSRIFLQAKFRKNEHL